MKIFFMTHWDRWDPYHQPTDVCRTNVLQATEFDEFLLNVWRNTPNDVYALFFFISWSDVKLLLENCVTLYIVHMNTHRTHECLCVSHSAPRIDGECEFVSSTDTSLKFRWTSATSATGYRLVGHSVNKTYRTAEVTVDSLTPGSYYTFTVKAIGSEGLESNTIACKNSTSVSIGIFLTWTLCVWIEVSIDHF